MRGKAMEGWVPKTKKEKEFAPRIYEIANYTADPRTPAWKKELRGFLLRDTMDEKEKLFQAMDNFVHSFRACKNCETKHERLFWVAYIQLITGNEYAVPKYCRPYALRQQLPIEGTKANVAPYRADFLNEPTKTIIEINGGIHDEKRKYDRKRTEALNSLGYTVLPFTNEEIEQDAMACAKETVETIERRWKKLGAEAFMACVMQGTVKHCRAEDRQGEERRI